MTEFSVNTRNRFELAGIDDEEDTDLHELLEKEQADKQKRAKEAEQAAKLKTAEKGKKDKRNTAVKTNNKNITNRSGDNSTNIAQQSYQSNRDSNNIPAKSSTYSRNDENRPPRLRNATQNRASNNENVNFEKPPQDFDRERRDGPGNYRGRGRGMRGNYGGNRPRREYERHSGSDKTGVKAVEKREGFGAHNWGGEISSQLDHPAEEQQNESVVDQATNGEVANGEPAGDATPTTETEEPKTEVKEEITYEEYLAKNARSKVVFENTRKANEGVDTKQWKKGYVLKKKKDDVEEEYESSDDDAVEPTKSALEQLNIQITFGDRGERRGRGGRGRGFGAPRGRGGFDNRNDNGSRGGFDRRGGRSRSNVPEIDNENFPSLGSR